MNGTEVIGGNLKEGPEVSLSATAIGVCDEVPLSRRGARVGDAVLVIGDLSLFWAGFFATQRNLSVLAANREYLQSNLLTPQPKVAVGAALAREKLVSAAVDNSDGLYPSLAALCEANGVGVILDFSGVAFPSVAVSVAEALNVDPIRFALGWGDWQLVVTSNPDLTEPAVRCGEAHGTPVHRIGEVVAKPGVSLTHEGRTGALLPLESERFSADSWFVAGLDEYARRMLELPLVTWP
jgi:thiamine-monophosphate kinase